MSGREPSTYTLRERGRGWTAASSTWAEAAMNFGWAFIVLSLHRGRRWKRAAGAYAPYAGMTRVRFKGTLSPGWRPGPLRSNCTSYRKGAAGANGRRRDPLFRFDTIRVFTSPRPPIP